MHNRMRRTGKKLSCNECKIYIKFDNMKSVIFTDLECSMSQQVTLVIYQLTQEPMVT